MPYLRVDEGDLYYHRVGEGAPLVFVNDWVLSQTYWQDVTQELSRDYCCVTYDPRGVGQSRTFQPNASYAIEAHAEDLHQVIISLRSGLVHVVGHGLGGLFAGLCLRAHPQDVQTLSLISAEAEIGASEVLDGRLKYIQTLIILRRLATVPLLRSLILRRYSLGELPVSARRALVSDFAHLNPRASWETIGTALEQRTYDEYIAGVSQANVPVLLLACGRDHLVSVESARKLFARIHRGRLVTMHGSGHFPMSEYPQKFTEILRDFLAATERSAPI
ncbi:MAG: alpha/beta hydrolase [Acidobacteria bacterium]|nr:alpha/beta hydrolase [Acidobacteriota bacterium]